MTARVSLIPGPPRGHRPRLQNHTRGISHINLCVLWLNSSYIIRGINMSKFIIGPHMRLQEWVAEEKGYFKEEGLDYDFIPSTGFSQLSVKSATELPKGQIKGAYQTIEAGRKIGR